MKRTLLLFMVAAMMLGLSIGAHAYLIKFQAHSTAATNTIGDTADFTTALPPMGGTGDVLAGLYPGNVVSDPPTLILLLMKTSTPTEWYGKIIQRGDPPPTTIDFRLYTSGAATAPTGTWYIWKGLGAGTPGSALASGIFDGTTISYASPAMSTTALAVGDYFTISNVPVPEPGSMVAMLTGLVGLVGYGIRRRK